MLRKLLLVMVMLAATALPLFAQELPPLPGEQIGEAMDAPRALAFDANGNLLVAVAGSGGDTEVVAPGPEGETNYRMGMSGRIVSIAPDGTSTDLIKGFPSYASEMETLGIYRVIPHGDSLWLLASIGAPGFYWADAIVELDATTLLTKTIISMQDFEAVNDPDGAGYDSNVSDIAWAADGTMYITNAGGNDLLSWTPEAGLQLVHAWTDNPVPTSIEIADNGDLYIGFLGAGVAPGAGRIERWSNGELAETFADLSAVSDILLDGDTLYAVQLVIFGEQGPGPGSVVTVSADGVTPVAEGLVAPFGIAKGPDGALYVTYGTLAFAPGMTGGVVKLAGM
jgi:hypothetical protein